MDDIERFPTQQRVEERACLRRLGCTEIPPAPAWLPSRRRPPPPRSASRPTSSSWLSACFDRHFRLLRLPGIGPAPVASAHGRDSRVRVPTRDVGIWMKCVPTMRHAVLVTAPLKSAPVKTEPTTVMIGVKMTAAGRHSRAVGHGAGIRGFLARVRGDVSRYEAGRGGW
jgi:hypothetical protein